MPQTANTKRELLVYVAVFIALWGALMLGRQQLLNDDDTIWHSSVGREILHQRVFPEVDTYSCTFQGQPWVAHQWLGECSLAIARAWAGWTGVVVMTAMLLAMLGVWIIERFRTRGCDVVLAVLLLVTGFLAAAANIVARPHLATLVLLGFVFAQLTDIEHRRIPLNRIAWFIPATALWANLHGGVLGGLGTVGIVFLGWSLVYLICGSGPLQSRRDVIKAWIVFSGCLLATLITPYGWRTLETWGVILTSNLQTLMVEHGPLDLHQPSGLAIALLAALHIGLLLTLRQRPRVTWLVPLVWLLLAISRIRHGALFAVVALISIAEMTPHTRVGHWLKSRCFWADTPQPSRKCPWLMIAALSVAILLASRVVTQAGGDFISPPASIWPPELVQELQQRSQQRVIHVFNGFELAGAIIDQCPNVRVFIDSRSELYGEEFLSAYVHGQKQPDVLEQWTDQFNLELALVENDSAWLVHLQRSPRWRLVKATGAVSLFERTTVNTMLSSVGVQTETQGDSP